jgi:tetratricopeptide (TPR) repeat protein
MPEEAPPRVFISYSHDSQDHEARVLALADRLRADGVEASIDQYEQFPPRGWRVWMRQEIAAARFVLSICTPNYKRRAEGEAEEGTGRGATREGRIIDQALYDTSGRNEKFVPVLLDGGAEGDIPDFLRDYRHFALDVEYEELRGFLLGKPKLVKPPLGAKPRLPDYHNSFWNLRSRNPFFSGRAEYLDVVHRALAAGASVQAIRGLGGVGKTETAIEYAYRHRGEYQAAFFITADSEDAVVSGLAGLAEPLGIAPEQDLRRPAYKVRDWFETQGGWLLILDNVEQAKDVQDWIPAGGHVLLTTRLNALGRIAEPLALHKLALEDGAALLFTRARVAGPSDAERAAALELAREVDGLPLALEQAGAYMESRQVTATEYLGYYRQQGARLRAAAGEDAAHASVAVTFTLAFERLGERARDIVRLCAFLAPEAIPEEILTGDKEADLEFREAVAEVGRYSLVERNAVARLLDMHRLVQEVVRDGMEESERRRWVERAVEAVNATFPFVRLETWSQCERLLPHARFAARWIEDFKIETPRATRLLNQAAYYLQERAQYQEAEPLYRRALEARERMMGPEHPDTLDSVNNLALLLQAEGDLAGAEPLYRRALDGREQVLGLEHRDTLSSVNNLGYLLKSKGDLAGAEPLYRRALEACERVLGSEHPDTLGSVNNLAVLLRAKATWQGPSHSAAVR